MLPNPPGCLCLRCFHAWSALTLNFCPLKSYPHYLRLKETTQLSFHLPPSHFYPFPIHPASQPKYFLHISSPGLMHSFSGTESSTSEACHLEMARSIRCYVLFPVSSCMDAPTQMISFVWHIG